VITFVVAIAPDVDALVPFDQLLGDLVEVLVPAPGSVELDDGEPGTAERAAEGAEQGGADFRQSPEAR
jgi:hypothetical protein